MLLVKQATTDGMSPTSGSKNYNIKGQITQESGSILMKQVADIRTSLNYVLRVVHNLLKRKEVEEGKISARDLTIFFF